MEERLTQTASRGNLNAFNQLVLRFRGIAYRRAYALVSDATSAEDITQESFVKAFRHIDRFRGGAFRAWLLKIVTNTAYDLLRERKRRPEMLFPVDIDGEEIVSSAWLSDPSPSVEAAVEQNEDTRCLYQLLEELPEIYRQVIMLADVYELDYVDVAEQLGVPIGTVKSRLARARRGMKQKLRAS